MTAVVNMAEPMCAIAVLLAYLLYWNAMHMTISNSTIGVLYYISNLLLYSFACFACICVAFLLKETGITVCGIIFGSSVITLVAQNMMPHTKQSVSKNTTRGYMHNGLHLYWLVFSLGCVLAYMVLRVLVVAYDSKVLYTYITLHIMPTIRPAIAYVMYCGTTVYGTMHSYMYPSIIEMISKADMWLFKNTKRSQHVLEVIARFISKVHTIGESTGKSAKPSMLLSNLQLDKYNILNQILSYLCPSLLMSETFKSYFPVVVYSGDIITADTPAKSWFLGNSGLIRKTENAYAFLTGSEKLLSLFYLHFRYLYQLLWPARLVAEYTYNCIPKVSSFDDKRNVYSIAMYGCLFIIGLIGLYWLSYPNDEAPADKVEIIPTTEIRKTENGSNPIPVVVNINTSGANLESEKDGEEIPNVVDTTIEVTADCSTELDSAEKSVKILSKTADNAADGNCTVDTANADNEVEMLPDSDSSFEFNKKWHINNEALLQGLMWMIVPFLPASGILRLGTLLAERLLYLPSIGYCWLLSLMIYITWRILLWTAATICTIFGSIVFSTSRKPSKAVQSIVELLAKLGYIVTIAVIVYYYSKLTIARNPLWKNDETLHRDTLLGCPESAKSHLQNSEIALRVGDLKTVKWHLDEAYRIDPDMCDIGTKMGSYLIAANDVQGAMVAFANNLQCVFTNMGSMKTLTKIMEYQNDQSPNNPVVLELHGDMFVIPGMHAVATQKYAAGMQHAINRKSFEVAMRLSLKIENAIKYFYNKTAIKPDEVVTSVNIDTSSEESTEAYQRQVAVDLECNSHANNGLFRLDLEKLIAAKKFQIPNTPLWTAKPSAQGTASTSRNADKWKYEISRGKALLFQSFQPYCVVINPNTNKLLSNPSLRVSDRITEIVKAGYGGDFFDSNMPNPSIGNFNITNTSIPIGRVVTRSSKGILDYAMYSEALMRIIMKMYHYSDKQSDLIRQAEHYRLAALALYREAAESYFFVGNDVNASLYSFVRVLFLDKVDVLSKHLEPVHSIVDSNCMFGAVSKCRLGKSKSFSSAEVIAMMSYLHQAKSSWDGYYAYVAARNSVNNTILLNNTNVKSVSKRKVVAGVADLSGKNSTLARKKSKSKRVKKGKRKSKNTQN